MGLHLPFFLPWLRRLFLPLYLCLSDCLQYNSKSWLLILTKVFGEAESVTITGWLDFGSDPDQQLSSFKSRLKFFYSHRFSLNTDPANCQHLWSYNRIALYKFNYYYNADAKRHQSVWYSFCYSFWPQIQQICVSIFQDSWLIGFVLVATKNHHQRWAYVFSSPQWAVLNIHYYWSLLSSHITACPLDTASNLCIRLMHAPFDCPVWAPGL